MDDSSPDAAVHGAVRWRAALVGAVVGVVAFAGGSLVLYDSPGLLTGATGLVGTMLVALAVGLWAGSPGALQDALPLRTRWVAAGLATALAGAFATAWTIYGQVGGRPFGRIAALLVLIALPIYALGLLLPVLLAWGERLAGDGDTVESGWGVLGELAAGLVTGAALGAVAAGLILIPRLTPGPLLLAASVMLLAPVILPEPRPPEDGEALLYDAATPFGTIRVTEMVFPGERQPERRLYQNDEEESGELVRSGAPTLGYIAAAERWLAAQTPAGSSYLFLGSGAYTLPRRVAERDPDARITVVELDPEVTRVAHRFFGLRREHGIATVHGDARAFLERAAESAAFDRIYLDVYDGREAVPYPLVTREAFALLQSRLRPAGWFAMNLIGVPAGPEALRFWSVIRTLEDVFPSVGLFLHHAPDFPDRQNVLAVAAAEEGRPPGEHAGLFEPWLRERWPESPAAVVFRDLHLPAASDEARESRAGQPARST